MKGGKGAVGGKPIAAPGDYVDFVAYACVKAGAQQDQQVCQSQTTLQNIYIYTVLSDSIIVVLTHQQTLELLTLDQKSTALEIVVRKPGDTETVKTEGVTDQYIISHFNFKTSNS